MRTPGWCENIRCVFSRRWSWRPRQDAATASARSITSGSSPARRISQAAASPAGPAPTITTRSSMVQAIVPVMASVIKPGYCSSGYFVVEDWR